MSRPICPGCGKWFYLSKDRKKYCSQPCAASTIGKLTAGNRRIQPRTKFIVLKCATCKKEFGSWKCANRLYCSPKCSTKETIKKSVKTKLKNGAYSPVKSFSAAKRGLRKDIGIYVRSSWEANYARYLNWLIKGNAGISKWEYEVDVFWFEKIKRGCRSYRPDFKVTYSDGSVEYHEVKGWMYPRAKTSLNRMRIYHPKVKVVLIDQVKYKALEKEVGHLIPKWEFKSKK